MKCSALSFQQAQLIFVGASLSISSSLIECNDLFSGHRDRDSNHFRPQGVGHLPRSPQECKRPRTQDQMVCGRPSDENHTTALPFCTAGPGCEFQQEPVNPNSVSQVHWCCGHTIGPPFASSFPGMGEHFSSESQWAQEQDDQNYTTRPSHTEIMEEEVISDQRGCSGQDYLSMGGSPDRCFFNWLGRSLAAQSGQRAMGFPAKGGEYKYPGTTSSATGTEALCAEIGRQACSCQVRQYVGGLSHQSSRGHKIQPVFSSITGAVDLGLPSAGEYQSNAHPRSDKSGGRPHLELIWQRFGRAEVDLFASAASTQGPLWFSQVEESSPLGQDALAHDWPGQLLYVFPPIPLIWVSVHRVLQEHNRLLLVAPNWPGRPWFPMYRLLGGEPWRLPRRRDLLHQLGGQIWHQNPERLQLCVWPLKSQEPLLRVCDQAVQNTIKNSRAPSTRSAYAYRWKFFSDCCREQRLSPEVCPVPLVLRFIQSLLERKRAASTLRVYVAAISAHHVQIDGQLLGSHALVTQILRVAQRLLSALFRNQAIELAVFNPPRLDAQGRSKYRLFVPSKDSP